MEITNFISPKQLIEMKNDIVETALAQANPIIAIEYKDGLFFMAENPSDSLNKITEVYDRVVFAGTGVFNDYEKLRKYGVQFADIAGFTYSRRDVHAKSVASEFSRILGDIFSQQHLPLEVEILVGELGLAPEHNRMYRILYHGGLVEEKRFCVIGDLYRDPETRKTSKYTIGNFLRDRNIDGTQDLATSFRIGMEAIAKVKREAALRIENIEVVVLDRTVAKERKMMRVGAEILKQWLTP